LAQNQILFANQDDTKLCIKNMSDYAQAHPDEEDDILGAKGKTLLQQVVS